MTWFLRTIELPDGHWQCRHGLLEIDTHPTLAAAAEHLAAMAASLRSAECFAHYQDGRIVQVGSTGET
ncbi:hypothetical protein JCM18899A_41440 [Nocardioides sp. AN3]